MNREKRSLKDVEINYITFESGDNEALIDCNIKSNRKSSESKLIISMSDLNKLISAIKKLINTDLNIECHKLNSDSSFYQIDMKKTGITKIDLSSFFFSGAIKQIIS